MSWLQTITKDFDRLDAKSKDFIRPQYVKEVFGLSMSASKFWLESAVRFYLLHKKYIVICPNCNDVVERFNYKFQVPPTETCFASDNCGEFETKERIEAVYIHNG